MPECWTTLAASGLLYLGALGTLIHARRHHSKVVSLIAEYRAEASG